MRWCRRQSSPARRAAQSLAFASIFSVSDHRVSGRPLYATTAPVGGERSTALEVDEIQHALNLQTTDLPNVEFKLAGAQAIPAPDNRFDVALMFKSLHHVPEDMMAPTWAASKPRLRER